MQTMDKFCKLCASFAPCFNDKVASLKRAATVVLVTLNLCICQPSYRPDIWSLYPVTQAEAVNVISSIPAKSCSLDYISASLIKLHLWLFADLVLANIAQGVFPHRCEFAMVTHG